jgi:hypothetical protein
LERLINMIILTLEFADLEVMFMKFVAVMFLSCLVLSACQQTEPVVAETKAAWLSPQTLPIGDGRITNYPSRGNVFPCQTSFPNIGGAFKDGPWIKTNGTFDETAKAIVDGNQVWPSGLYIRYEYAQRVTHISSNGLPSHPTGWFPIGWWDDAYNYDRNPNQITSKWLDYNLPPIPIMGAAPRCVPSGAIGIMYSGAVLFNALDGQGKDAVAHEVQDSCQGHPEIDGLYHYHSLSKCLDDSGWGHSKQLGYALDGFGIFGHKGENGQDLTNFDLDECHGHTHWIPWGGQWMWMYHYHATHEYPYTIGCFRGAPLPKP